MHYGPGSFGGGGARGRAAAGSFGGRDDGGFSGYNAGGFSGSGLAGSEDEGICGRESENRGESLNEYITARLQEEIERTGETGERAALHLYRSTAKLIRTRQLEESIRSSSLGSGGKGTEPMQASECSFNTKYPKKPNGITDSEYSVMCGVRYFRQSMEQAKVSSPVDMDHIKLALQGFNFGNGYISWAVSKYGSYSYDIEYNGAGKLGLLIKGMTSSSITSHFGSRSSPGGIGSTNHQGIDIGFSTGTNVLACESGTVTLAGVNGATGSA